MIRERILEELEIEEFDESVRFDGMGKRNMEESKEGDKADEMIDFEFGPSAKHGRFEQPTNSKKEMLAYLENKSQVISLHNSKNSFSFYESQSTHITSAFELVDFYSFIMRNHF